jgi:hypothetical protein
MKSLIPIVGVFALLLAVAPAMAGDGFHALGQLITKDRAALPPLPDDQLASVEGGDLLLTMMQPDLQKPVPGNAIVAAIPQLRMVRSRIADQTNSVQINLVQIKQLNLQKPVPATAIAAATLQLHMARARIAAQTNLVR